MTSQGDLIAVRRKTAPDWHCDRCKRPMWAGRSAYVEVENGLAWRRWFICRDCNVEREKALECLREWERAAWRAV